MDQNSKTKDLPPADESNQDIHVDDSLEKQKNTENHGSVSEMEEEASANPFVTKVIDLGASGKSPTTTEKEFLPLVNTEIEDAAKQTESTRPKRHSKPSTKVIENRLQADTQKLENMW